MKVFALFILLSTCLIAGEEVAAVGQEGVTPPVFTKKITPVYPAKAMADNIYGYVIVQALVPKDGQMRDFQVLRGLGKGQYGFEESAMEALSKWEYQPGMVDGQPADVRMTLKIDFVPNPQYIQPERLAWSADEATEETAGPSAKYAKGALSIPTNAVSINLPVTFNLDEAGAASSYSFDSSQSAVLGHEASIEKFLDKALEVIEFSPAKTHGVALASSITLRMTVPLD